MLVEGLRTDSLLLPGTDLRISQGIGLLCFLAGMILFVLCFFLGKKKEPLCAESAQEAALSAQAEAENEESVSSENMENTEEKREEEQESEPEKGE
jgi:Sec-independent protein translocase protein TatA